VNERTPGSKVDYSTHHRGERFKDTNLPDQVGEVLSRNFRSGHVSLFVTMAATATMTMMAPASVSPMRRDVQDEDDDASLCNWTVVSDTPTVPASNVSEAQRRKVRPFDLPRSCPVKGQTRVRISNLSHQLIQIENEQVRNRIERSRQRQTVNEALEKAWFSMSSVLFAPPGRWLDPQPQHQDSMFVLPHPHGSSIGKPPPGKRTWGRTRLH
jgi:hypothetical protein